MIERGGQVIIRMLENVQQKTIKPIITKLVEKGSQLYTDEYAIYDRLEAWGYLHKRVNHSAKEYAMRVTMTTTGFTRFTSTLLRGFGPCFVPGYVRTGASPKKSYLYT